MSEAIESIKDQATGAGAEASPATLDRQKQEGSSGSTQNGIEVGAQWRRWDPHLHAPGTLLNDQFGGDWNGYLTAIETATPAVEVLGITDYFSIACYREVRRQQAAGRLPDVRLLFPNVEMRLDLATDRSHAINLHLLFCPDDANHEEQIERVLADLTFEYKARKHRCSPAELAALGRAHNPALKDDGAARREGANQFKVTIDQLRKMFREDAWVSRNCIVAVAASSNDGTAGLQKNTSFTALRREVERFAQVIFSATPSVRQFWLGMNASCNLEMLEKEYAGTKPCLHGSDAHSVDKTVKPDDERNCWIKGDPSFETLRQAILEPEGRVWIGRTPPDHKNASMCISCVKPIDTPWIANSSIPLNAGLVAIIGSRGSGKTALADIMAIGANVISPFTLTSSFLHRASNPVNHIGDAQVTLEWANGNASESQPLCPQKPDDPGQARNESVRYLSQQFVDQLCAAEGLAVELRQEIERVIFSATDPTDRLDADSFDQYADVYLNPIRQERRSLKESIQNASSQVVDEEVLAGKVQQITKKRDDLQAEINKKNVEMLSLMPKDKEARAKRLATLEAAVESSSAAVNQQKRRSMRVGDLQKEVGRMRTTLLPQYLEKLKHDFQEAGLTEADWANFSLTFTGDVDTILLKRKQAIEDAILAMTKGDPTAPVSLSKGLAQWPYDTLCAERDKLQKEVGIDAQKQQRYTVLQRALGQDQRSFRKAADDLTHANGAHSRRQDHIERRRKLYEQVFATYLSEQKVLETLYAPLQKLLLGAKGSLSRLRFSVTREIDLASWVQAGEALLDLRKESPFRGQGGLAREAERLLYQAWKFGDAAAVSNAMQSFIQEMYTHIEKSMPSALTPLQAVQWRQQIASWLYGTDHIQLRYGITYDGVAIEQLSPGTRGIVLLLLYLVIDQHDRRPLIIDQPEENLDPQSVFEELVPHFREARLRRQIIIVTHNANLVVNTDADQVIVASSARADGIGLPTVTYRSGSLENPTIRKAVCDILEGGERAFLDRERRYRLNWETPQ